MMQYCKEHDYHYQLLVHDPIFHAGPISETYTNNKDNPTIEKITDFAPNELSNIQDNINNGRFACHLYDTQKYMMDFAWIIPDELHLLESFGYIIFIDTTKKTNNEK